MQIVFFLLALPDEKEDFLDYNEETFQIIEEKITEMFNNLQIENVQHFGLTASVVSFLYFLSFVSFY